MAIVVNLGETECKQHRRKLFEPLGQCGSFLMAVPFLAASILVVHAAPISNVPLQNVLPKLNLEESCGVLIGAVARFLAA